MNAECAGCTQSTRWTDKKAPKECVPTIFKSCFQAYSLGMPSGYYSVFAADGTHHDAYCVNDESLGWKLDTSGPAKGGGWEIVHTLIGGHNLKGGQKSNYDMRHSAQYRTDKLSPFNLKEDFKQIVTKSTQMTNAWHRRAKEKGGQWMKFMTAYQGNRQRKQDRQMMDMDSKCSMDWFFPNNNVNMGGGWGCRSMPGIITMYINGKNVGKTNKATGHTGSIGLSNQDNDPCGSGADNYIRARHNQGAHKFSRIDGATQDNSIRHLISYSDRNNGMSASRCGYCCWGCGGWTEMVMWGYRPN